MVMNYFRAASLVVMEAGTYYMLSKNLSMHGQRAGEGDNYSLVHRALQFGQFSQAGKGCPLEL